MAATAKHITIFAIVDAPLQFGAELQRAGRERGSDHQQFEGIRRIPGFRLDNWL
ncbi:hypothetical protein [Thiorhodovibrio litoralis]|uniref:hypothetical protein n=1 Tax=Thiorhodovibrio litoralis TaxID=2952932 RepID=UPI002B25D298|nr:hypothetical protein [Thiorhodovibrio litoralis]